MLSQLLRVSGAPLLLSWRSGSAWRLHDLNLGADNGLGSGPFEFTKLSSQIELLMARSRMASVDDPSHITKYQPKGTFQSASSIVQARGFGGLYSGFHLHFSKLLPA